MKLRPQIVVDIAARHLTPEENMTFACLLSRVPDMVEAVSRLEGTDFTSEAEVADALRELVHKFGPAEQFSRAKSFSRWLDSLPPPPALNLSEAMLRSLNDISKRLGVSRDALVRASVELIARLPESAKAIDAE